MFFHIRKNCQIIECGQAKKHVFGSSVGRRGGGCQTLACALGVPSYDLKFSIYAVICRVCVKIV
jgi:hypothetical protein